MILNLRGPSGSGKSYPGFQLKDLYGPPEEVRSLKYFGRKKPKLIAQILPGGLCLAGRYTMKKSTRTGGIGYSGGVDGFYPMEELNGMIQDLCDEYPHVLFESLMISGTHQRWEDFGKKNEALGRRVVFGTLDTPIELCLERIQSRNGGVPIKEESVVRHRAQVHKCAAKFHAAGLESYTLDHTRSLEQVEGLFRSDGWDPAKP